MGERFQVPAFLRAHFADTFGDGFEFAFLAGIDGQEPVCLTIVLVLQHDRINPERPEFLRHTGLYQQSQMRRIGLIGTVNFLFRHKSAILLQIE